MYPMTIYSKSNAYNYRFSINQPIFPEKPEEAILLSHPKNQNGVDSHVATSSSSKNVAGMFFIKLILAKIIL